MLCSTLHSWFPPAVQPQQIGSAFLKGFDLTAGIHMRCMDLDQQFQHPGFTHFGLISLQHVFGECIEGIKCFA